MSVLEPRTISLSFSNNALIWCSFGSHPIPIWLYFSFHPAFIGLRVARIWRAHGAHLTRAWLAHGAHLAHIWLALARTRLALSSHLRTDFTIWPIVTVPFPVFCVCFYVHACIYTFGFTSKTSSSVFAHWAARLRSPPTRVFVVPLWFNFIVTRCSVMRYRLWYRSGL